MTESVAGQWNNNSATSHLVDPHLSRDIIIYQESYTGNVDNLGRFVLYVYDWQLLCG